VIDCSPCDLPNQPVSAMQPCQQSGPNVYVDPSVSNLGTKQIPLLHLVYEICTQSYGPHAREGRKTWLAVKYSKTTGQPLTPPKYEKSIEGATQEVHHMIGMVLAQRAHFLPIWAQLSREHQLEVATAIASLLKGEPLSTDRLSPIQMNMFKGSAHLALQGAAQELAHERDVLAARILKLGEEIATMQSRLKGVDGALQQIDTARAEIESHMSALTYHLRQMQQEQALIRSQNQPLFDENGALYNETLRAFQIDTANLSAEQEQAVYNAVARYQELDTAKANEIQRITPQMQELEKARQPWLSQRGVIEQAIQNGELLYDRLEEALLNFLLTQLEAQGMSEFALQTQKEAQPTLQKEALQFDYALQPGNYVDQEECKQLAAILQNSGVARQIFLFLDPRLKYSNESKVTCRLRKLLAAPEFLKAFQDLDGCNLIQPGPFAKLGAFIINALVPGSYDERHRVLAREDIGKIQQAMVEHGMDPTIRCHSCGTTEPSGQAPVNAATDWIRDHNPPTAFYKLGAAVYGRLGLPDYAGNGRLNGQILLPQCRECSKRQGAITGKVIGLIEALAPNQAANPLFDLAHYIQNSLTADDPADWVDFLRLVCNPKGGWSAPQDLSMAVSGFDLTRLVVTGDAGSFVGIDDQLLKQVGVAVGCHTCTDVAIQNDPYRNILWIADHQPPTALVARGLMELPQVVYPHCWNCSETQSKMIATLCRLFERCFGKEFKKQWVQLIKDQAWKAMSS